MSGPLSYEELRNRMVEEQLIPRRIRDQRVLEAMRTVPRHLFVSEANQHLAYYDGPLLIGEHQTISQPYIVALMSELLELKGDEKVLEIGTGSGYQAAVLSYLAQEVHTVERFKSLADSAELMLQEYGYANVHVHHADGSLGWVDEAPYNGILVTAAAPKVPRPLLDQLAEGAFLVIPVGGKWGQKLQRWVRKEDNYHCEDIVPVAFVPLRGEEGWNDKDWQR